MDFSEAADYIAVVQKQVAGAAAPTATAMANTVQDRIQRKLRSGVHHPPGMYYKATAGATPAYASGNLARSIVVRPAFGTGVASAMVAAGAKYAAVQEFGAVNYPTRSAYMHWVNDRGAYWKKEVTVPAHPYFEPAIGDVIRDGSLSRTAARAYMQSVSPVFV